MAGPATTGNGQIVRNEKKAESPLSSFIEQHKADFAMVLPRHITPERMTRLALSAIRTTRDMDKCSLASFAGCIMACSTLGLEPNTPLGHAYLIPRRSRKTNGHECTLIIGYRGLIDLMYRSGMVSAVKAEAVFDGDVFEFEKGLNPRLKHIPCGEDDPNKLTHVYTIVRWKAGGDPIWDVMTRREILKHRDRGGYNPERESPWRTDFVSMALKTGVRAIARWAPTSTERDQLQRAVAYEEASDRGSHNEAINALGDAPAKLLEDAHVETVDAEYDEVPERQPGDDS